MEQKLIGRKEKITLPELGLNLVWAKIDTGAYTSSLHAEEIREEEMDGKKVLKFQILMPKHQKFTGKTLVFENYREKKVKNSFGQAEVRYLIETKLQLAGETYRAEFTLTDRSSMKNSILLGRKILRGRFLVDVSKTNLGKTYRKKK
ncbi:RimK/LysX family protein [Algoriphagus sp. AK58]|uniref:ATP-dependent zinc protease family protein n=1 Tax=Algoriphagus sp. AK58 TaxID=1406877 RepID=UPI00164FD6D7|nr:RimK/LysX family protein [Algoriphagus sp. AK58]MBC6368412.1 ATP-dependent zinc protease [Algoriphagus sp. AK58]